MSQPALRRDSLFDNRALVRLLIPLLVEQFLIVFIGIADTVMVSGLGEASVSAVSLVDNINVLMNQVFGALATGGSVVAAQYLGKGERGAACASAKQLYQAMIIAGVLIALVVGVMHAQVLRLVFGELDSAIWRNASVYLIISACAYPFIGAYSAGSAMYRAMGNSQATMTVALIMTVTKLALNALMIYGLDLGVMGAALGTLLARIVSAAVYTVWIRHTSNRIFIHDFRKLEWRPDLIRKILHIGVPTGIENGLFQIGKLMTLNLVAGLGVASIAANAIAGSVTGLFLLPGNAMSLALVTVVGQCMGAGEADRAGALTKKLIGVAMGALLLSMAAMYGFARPLIGVYNLSGQATDTAVQLIRSMAPLTVILWPLSFALPNTLRAAGDVRFTMSVSMCSMWLFRVGLSYVFVHTVGMGVLGVWMAMYVDWATRASFFVTRFLRGRWKSLRVI